MASIKVIVAGYEAELDIPDDDQVMDGLRYAAMLTITAEKFAVVANQPTGAGAPATARNNQLTALTALQAAIDAARDAALPALELKPA